MWPYSQHPLPWDFKQPEMTVPLLRSVAALLLQLLHHGRQAQNEIKEKCVLFHQ